MLDAQFHHVLSRGALGCVLDQSIRERCSGTASGVENGPKYGRVHDQPDTTSELPGDWGSRDGRPPGFAGYSRCALLAPEWVTPNGQVFSRRLETSHADRSGSSA